MGKKKSNYKKQAKAESPQQSEPVAAKSRTTKEAAEVLPVGPVWDKVFFGSLIAVFVLMTVMSFSFGLSGDEVDMNEYGKAILKYFTSLGADDTVFNMPQQYDRDGVILYYGGFFDFICAIVNKFSPFAEYTTRHILNAWAGFLAILFSARIATFITDKRVGTICVWLMFLSPFFLGHAMNNPKDIPFATAYIAAIYYIIRFFDKFPKASKLDYLWVILSIGITINIRIGGLLLIPYLVVYAGIIYLLRAQANKGDIKLNTFYKPLAIIGILGYFAGSLFWPYAHKDPISNPLNALSEMSNFKMNLAQIWEGEKMYSNMLPSSYLIKSFGITNTYALLAGLLVFLFTLALMRKSKKSYIIYFVLFTALFPLLYIIYKKSNVYHAWRHVLFIFPSVVVIASLGWHYFNVYLANKWKKGAALMILGVLLLEPVVFIASTFPNTVTYHNQFVGGVRGAYGNYEVDYYYNSVKQCADWFIENEIPKIPEGDTVLVVSNAFHLLVNYLDGYDNVVVDYIRYGERNIRDYDYAIFHIALLPLEDIKAENWFSEKNTLFVAEVKGKPLSALIKRGSGKDIKGFSALQQGDRETAVSYFKQFLEENPRNTNVLTVTARTYMEMNKMDSAYTYATRAYEVDNTGMETKRVYAMALTYNKEYQKALTLFQDIIKERPDFVAAYYYMGIVYASMGNPQEAIKNLSIAAQEPTLARECYTMMGNIYKQMGNEAEANKMYQLANAGG